MGIAYFAGASREGLKGPSPGQRLHVNHLVVPEECIQKVNKSLSVSLDWQSLGDELNRASKLITDQLLYASTAASYPA